ncbi:MAG TPA: isoprenylcysteine carboxylmethyltransferase family protein [Candidatus Polarisedimenticolaceae bacterium]|nr:isoprenylcysteine carboxylmethyltransferase family protein [Candidatus Polarisedimenticolaceae bacterium]
MTEDNPGVLVFPPLLFSICVLAGLILHFTMGVHAAFPMWVRLGGVALGIASMAFAWWAQRVMRAAGTNIHPGQPTTAIVEQGPFAHTRNPLYLSLTLLFVGIGIALASPAFLALLLPFVAILRWGVIAREERYLDAKFGDTYRSYKARVRRWV